MTDYPTANTSGPRTGRARLIVLHSTETPCGTARAVARNFQNTSRRASAHWVVGTDGTFSGVPESHVAWAAPGANHDGIQIEQAGYAYRTDWTTGDGLAVLTATAAVVAGIHARLGIPLVHLSDAQLAAGASGVVTHAQVSRVYHRSDHTDPGPAYPMAAMLAMATGAPAPAPTTIPTNTPTASEEEPVFTIIKSPGRVHALVGPGYYLPLSRSEQLEVALGVLPCQIRDTLNDRQYDVTREIMLAGVQDSASTAHALADVRAALGVTE